MRRENVIGDVCHVIELLMEKYQAFPVLESSVGNFESGGKQLELVYKSVSSMYLQGENDARNALRKHHWKGANSWTHPRLLKRIWDNKNKVWHETDTEPLNLYPGAAVNPAGTSQTCQHCGINPVALLRNQKGAPETLPVGEGGEVHLKTEEGRKITLRL